ncbi:hypothetical protein PVAND_007788 [Polypedilum vanderplanki]|uniref:Uncharacterized protein n=1 Tax=Polypedilum vanderplanki TaxID=319348 RepID=A0A9J6C8W4_POLVA|nr:hypothetical protein PVAND_007788 [Polypedilum vanderplanki]
MKLLVIAICLILGVALAAQLTPEEEDRIFEQWLREHNIKVPHDEAYKQWKANVIQRLNEIEAHNEDFRNGKVKFKQVLNHFAHLSSEEISKTKHGHKNIAPDPSKVIPVVTRPKRAADDIPAYWNWYEKGIVSPPLDQRCGCCYAHAGTGVIEAHACKHFGKCIKLSEQEALECTKKCEGGNYEMIFQYAKDNGGMASDLDHPYVLPDLTECSIDVKNNARVPNTKVVDWKVMPNDSYTIMHTLYNKGPLYAGLHIFWNFYFHHEGVYDTPKNETNDWHALMLVGYGTESDGTDYWIVRNSWSTKWGVNGLAKIKRGVDILKIESAGVAYPILE